MKRHKPKDTTNWRLHPTKGWKKIWYGERKYREEHKASWLQRIRERFSFDIETMKPTK